LRVTVYSIMYNEEKMVSFWLRYYDSIASRIVVFDDNSIDRTREILQRSPKVEIRTPSKPLLDDGYFAHLFSTTYREDRTPDWIMCVDADEFIWAEHMTCALRLYKFMDVDVVQCRGIEMKCESFPIVYDNEQILDCVKHGRPTDWSSFGRKPCLFNPRIDIEFLAGRHGAQSIDCGGREPKIVNDEEVKVLHYRDLGYQHYLAHHQKNAARLDPNRRDKTWGIANYSPMTEEEFDKHVLDVERIIP